jgi:hypothetical protein
MYWRLLTSNPTAARDIVLSDKPVISTETDRMDKGMLDQVGILPTERYADADQAVIALYRYSR